MKVEVNSIWDSQKGRPNPYISIKPENDMDKAFLRALYYTKPRIVQFTDGDIMLDFYPKAK